MHAGMSRTIVHMRTHEKFPLFMQHARSHQQPRVPSSHRRTCGTLHVYGGLPAIQGWSVGDHNGCGALARICSGRVQSEREWDEGLMRGVSREDGRVETQ